MSDLDLPLLPRRLIRLINQVSPQVMPPAKDPAADAFQPFSLPAFPLSLSAWLAGLGEYFYGHHRRGLAVLLTLNVSTRTWAKPLLPTQQCDVDGASFRLLEQDAKDRDGHRIAGSYLLTAYSTADQAASLVPRFDGLHMVLSRREGYRRKHMFLRLQGVVRPVLEESVIVDDWRQYLFAYQHRLILTP